MKLSKNTAKPAAAPDIRISALITVQRQLQNALLPALACMRGVHATVITAALALQQQSADADSDVARMLLYSAAAPLGAEIERLDVIFSAFSKRAPPVETACGGSVH